MTRFRHAPWSTTAERDILIGTHSAYKRLSESLRPVRTIVLEHQTHALTVTDTIEGTGDHLVTIPLHLAPGVEVAASTPGRVELTAGGKTFVLLWSSEDAWTLEVAGGRVSPSYGVVRPCTRLLWRRSGSLPTSLTMSLGPSVVVRTIEHDQLAAVAASR